MNISREKVIDFLRTQARWDNDDPYGTGGERAKYFEAAIELIENVGKKIPREFVEKYAKAITGDDWMGNMQFETINTAVRLTKMLAELGHEVGKEKE